MPMDASSMLKEVLLLVLRSNMYGVVALDRGAAALNMDRVAAALGARSASTSGSTSMTTSTAGESRCMIHRATQVEV